MLICPETKRAKAHFHSAHIGGSVGPHEAKPSMSARSTIQNASSCAPVGSLQQVVAHRLDAAAPRLEFALGHGAQPLDESGEPLGGHLVLISCTKLA